MAKRFEGKVAVITGASAGIGMETARAFVEEGASVVLAARGQEKLQAVVDELNADGGTAIGVPTDVADLDACRRLLERARDELGAIHYLVNNAGAHFRGQVEDRTADELASMIDVNTRAPIYLSRAVLPFIRESGGGAVVQVASLAGQVPLPTAATYSASKWALRTFSLALADELQDSGITVSIVSPGPIIDTEFMMGNMDEASDVNFAQQMSTARQIADMVLDCAHDGKRERSRPMLSSVIATATYLVPGIRRVLGPVMEMRGRQMKAYYRRQRDEAEAKARAHEARS